MEFIDFHSHIYPEQIAKKATDSICGFYDIDTPFIGTPDEKIRVDKQYNIKKSVLLPVAVNPKHVHSINMFSLKTAGENDHFVPFATVHAADENIEAEAGFILNSGFKGIKIHPEMQNFSIDDKRLFPFYDTVQGKIPVMFHAGDPRYDYSHPEKIKKILGLFPSLTVVAAHLGGWHMQEIAFPLLKDEERCFVDASSSICYLSAEKNAEYIRGYGAERVFFGTDYPVGIPSEHIDTLLNLPLSDDEKESIAYKNAEKFLCI